MQKKIKDALQKRLDAVSDDLQTTMKQILMIQTIIEKHKMLFTMHKKNMDNGSSMMRLAKDLDMDVSDDKYDRLNYY